jgi:sensor histidine kinase regulating citrate/malate metabolism
LELKDPDQAYTNLGIVSVGQEVIRTVSLINRSLKTVKFKVLPADKKEFAGCALTMTPIEAQTVVLKPKELHHVEIKFRPKERIKPFEHDIML